MPQPQYTSISLASAIQQLAARLNDSSNVHWSQTELQNAIVESLRIFQSLTGFYRERVTFNTIVNTTFYDLRSALNTQSGSTYPYAFSVTDNQLLSEIQDHLNEPSTNPWTGTAQFSIPAINAALQRARDQFLSDTGVYCTRSTPFSGMPSNGRVQLPQSTLDIRRAAWQDSSTLKTYGLVRTDEYAALGYSPSWPQQSSLPYSYSVAVTPPISIQLIPAPVNSGALDLCLLSSGPTLSCDPANPVILGVPDGFCWAVKYGALADLLSEDGPSTDHARSAYCRTLYQLAMMSARNTVTVLLGRIQDIETPVGSIDDYDRYKTDWQNLAAATPTDIFQIAPNLLGLLPQPDTIYTLSLDMARSMPVPQTGGDFLQVALDTLEPILDMSQHIASFKLGGQEFMQTTLLRDNFLRMAGLMNARLKANVYYNLMLSQPATRQDKSVPRLVSVGESA